MASKQSALNSLESGPNCPARPLQAALEWIGAVCVRLNNMRGEHTERTAFRRAGRFATVVMLALTLAGQWPALACACSHAEVVPQAEESCCAQSEAPSPPACCCCAEADEPASREQCGLADQGLTERCGCGVVDSPFPAAVEATSVPHRCVVAGVYATGSVSAAVMALSRTKSIPHTFGVSDAKGHADPPTSISLCNFRT